MGRKPKRDRTLRGLKRHCLKCGVKFLSTGPGNRMCIGCSSENYLIETGKKKGVYYGR